MDGVVGVGFSAPKAGALGNMSLILWIKRRFAICAAKFGPETDAIFEVRGKRNPWDWRNAREL